MRKLMMLMAMLALLASSAYAQQRVTGIVVSAEDDEPLVGATVRVDGHTTIATATDLDGRFTLNNVPNSAKNLEVSYIGYTTKKVKIAPELTIRLETYSETMDEVIVVAFGKQKKESFTGSASVVNSQQIEKMTVNNPIEALNGNVTGLNMTENNSLTGDPQMTVRGIGSLNAGTEPLIVLDGLPYNGYYNDINPAEVASITVLKDAASNALYGARGANGVILITTKSAQRGSTRVTLDAKWGCNTDGRINYDIIRDPGQYYEAQYMQLRNYLQNSQGYTPYEAHIKANENMAGNGTGGLGYIVYDVPQGQTLIGTNGKLNPNATLGNRIAYNGQIFTLLPDDWDKLGLRDSFRQEYNLNVSGGNEKSTFLANIGYMSNQGLAYGEDIKRFNGRIKADFQAYDWLKIGGNAKYSKYDSNSSGNVYSLYTSIAPIYPAFIRDANGQIMTDSHGKMYDYGDGGIIGLVRPVIQSDNSLQDDLLDLSTNSSNAFQFQGFATIDLPAGFQITVNGSTYLTENRMNSAAPPYYGWYANTGGYTFVGHYRTQDFNYQQMLNWSRQFGNHSVDVLLGHEYSRYLSQWLQGTKNMLASYEYNTELDGAVQSGEQSSHTTQSNVEGYFMRAQYDYDNKYFASGSFRRDGSSNFDKKHCWGNFWSIGGAWIMTKEDWFPQTPYVNMLKLKVSYGEQGNDAIGHWRYTDTYKIGTVNGNVAYSFRTKGNPDITWETVGSLNTGVEFEFFNSRLNGGLEFYVRNTRDMLMQFSVPTSLGYTYYYDNIGDMRNTGIELQLNGDIIKTKHFGWNVGMNLTWEKNRVTYLPDQKKGTVLGGYNGYNDGDTFIAEGLPVYSWRLKRFAGVDHTTGKSLFYKNLSDGTLGTTTSWDDGDYYLCGTALPDIFGGLNTSIRIYDFDLSVQANYSVGGKKMDGKYLSLMYASTVSYSGAGIHKDVFKSWTPQNTESNIPIWELGDLMTGAYTDRWLTDASFIGLRNATLGYNFPKSIVSKLKMSRLRLFATCENIYYWTHRKGFDPRTSAMNGNKDQDGYTANFPMRTFSGGLQIQF